jgi:hypothetical protein
MAAVRPRGSNSYRPGPRRSLGHVAANALTFHTAITTGHVFLDHAWLHLIRKGTPLRWPWDQGEAQQALYVRRTNSRARKVCSLIDRWWSTHALDISGKTTTPVWQSTWWCQTKSLRAAQSWRRRAPRWCSSGCTSQQGGDADDDGGLRQLPWWCRITIEHDVTFNQLTTRNIVQ